jgi:1-aminocyclopropane-1-carboxylate deaminase/D-cysteine desulfhydrase-like pyridoxal-dependent ACC family enzyme
MTSLTVSTRLVRAGAPIPHIELFSKPTPVEPIPRFGDALTQLAAERGHDEPIDAWIKRDDLMSIGLGGNKLRNLEFHVGAAIDRGADVLVTAGRRRANHCRLTAAAAARVGLGCILVLSGPEPAEPSPNERICKLVGADMRYAANALLATRDALLRDVLAEVQSRGAIPYEVELGASGTVGASGQVLAGMELAEQLRAARVSADYLFVGAATGGTYAGLRVGLWLAGLGTEVVCVPTYFSSASSESEFRGHLVRLMSSLRELWSDAVASGHAPWRSEILLDDLTSWLPYGVDSPDAAVASRLLGGSEGIAADPVYTARVAASMVAWARAGRLAGKTVVLWHGGGTPALFEDYGSPAHVRLGLTAASATVSPGGSQ